MAFLTVCLNCRYPLCIRKMLSHKATNQLINLLNFILNTLRIISWHFMVRK